MESRIPDEERRIRRVESRIPDEESRIPGVESRIPNEEWRNGGRESAIGADLWTSCCLRRRWTLTSFDLTGLGSICSNLFSHHPLAVAFGRGALEVEFVR